MQIVDSFRAARLDGPAAPELLAPARLHDLFSATAATHGDRIAVETDTESWTYEELTAHANRLARHLRAQGVGRGDAIALLLDRTPLAYVAILGTLFAGAAYVPLDPGFPRARIAAILEDSGAKMLLATSDLDLGEPFAVPTLELDKIAHMLLSLDAAPLAPDAQFDSGPRDLAYIIFTSGSTGRPKGVAIEHMSAVHYVRAASRLYDMRDDDRVYQGFTLAFDAAVEEVWCAFANGARLLQAPAIVARSGPDLGPWLKKHQATVLSTVPTLAALLDPELPSLRLLILGGEACPPEVARRWLNLKDGVPTRRVFNTYGPTEATVIITAQEILPDRKLTIGTPLANHSSYVLDDAMRPLPPGTEGELWVGGPQLARGYLGIGVDHTRFTSNPDPDPQAPPRLYRTGDRVRVENGEINFLGRVDDQVKIRGYRVELGEIENALADVEGVRAIAVSSFEETPGAVELVAHVVPAAGFETSIGQDLVAWARGKLPSYMVPAFVETMNDLPRLPSGKIDRKRLAPPSSPRVGSASEYAEPTNDRERFIAAAFAKRFGRDTVSIDDDFFQDLGGHSLLAAGLVSDLRGTPDFAHLGVADLYTYPTVRKLAEAIAAPPADEIHVVHETSSRVPFWRWSLFSAGQLVGVYALYLLVAAQYILPVATIVYDPDSTFGEVQFIVGLTLLSMSVYYPGLIIASVPLKWLIIGRIRPGDYDAYGLYAFRFWLVRRLLNMAPVRFLVHSPLLNTYYRLLGAQIGPGVVLGTDAIMAPDLLTIDAQTTIGKDVQMLGYQIVRGRLRIGAIRVGARSYVGTNSVLAPDVVLGEDVLIADQSLVPRGARLQASTLWAGSPVQPASAVDPLLAAVRERALADRGNDVAMDAVVRVFQAVWAFAIVLVPLAAAIPGFSLFLQAWNDSLLLSLVVAPIAASVFLGLLLVLVTIIKRLLVPRLPPGLYHRTSGLYVRQWAAQRLIDLAMEFLRPFTGTLYFPWVLRMFGAKIGKGAECSSDAPLSIDLVTIGPDAFIADASTVGAPKRFGDWVGFAETRIGARAFIGNSALVRAGTDVGDDALLAVMSAPPPGVTRLEPGSSWLGCPALRLPGREIVQGIDATRTYDPPKRLVLARFAIEFFRATLPFGLQIVTLFAIIAALNDLYEENDLWQLILLAPFTVAGYALVATAFVIAIKWIVIGTYRPKTVPLWSAWVWTSEMVTGLYETIVVPLLLDIVLGTPIAPLVLRAFGTKMGRRVWMETSFITEFDLVEIGDEAEIGQDTDLQTHLFEDRVMKMGPVKIGAGCTVGRSATVLYDTEMEPGARLGDLSLLMKGERLAAGTSWVGAPARRAST